MSVAAAGVCVGGGGGVNACGRVAQGCQLWDVPGDLAEAELSKEQRQLVGKVSRRLLRLGRLGWDGEDSRVV